VVASYNNASKYCKAAGKGAQFCCGFKNEKQAPSPNTGYGKNVRTIFKPDAPPSPPSPPPSPPSPPPPPPLPAPNVYVTTLSSKPAAVEALRLPDGRRGIRARYPNADPEVNGMHTIPTG
jgi:hypothetical protein